MAASLAGAFSTQRSGETCLCSPERNTVGYYLDGIPILIRSRVTFRLLTMRSLTYRDQPDLSLGLSCAAVGGEQESPGQDGSSALGAGQQGRIGQKVDDAASDSG